MLKNRISLIIPVFCSNLLYLKQAVASVQNQTSDNWILILVDGNEQPDKKIAELVKNIDDSRITYCVNDKNKSMAGNWNYSIQVAKSDLVTLLHDDDMLEATYVERIVETAYQHPNSAAFYTDINLIDKNGQPTRTIADSIKRIIKPPVSGGVDHLTGDQGLSTLLKGCFIFCPTVCYRKSRLPCEVFSYQWSMVVDFQFYFDTLFAGKTLTGINEKLYKYRRHQQNQTAKLTDNMKRFEEEIAFYNIVHEQVSVKWPLSAKVARKKSIIKLHLLFLIMKNLCKFDVSRTKTIFRFYLSSFYGS